VSRGQHSFRERDLTRAVRAVVKAGVPVRAATVDAQGKITVIIANGDSEDTTENPWDRALAEMNGGQ